MSLAVVEPDPRTSEPHYLWEEVYSKERICRKIDPPLSLNTPIREDAVRFVCVSDTHEKLGEIIPRIPPGDVLVHCGDFTNFGDREQIAKFNEEISRLPHKFKIVIAGNHELGLEDDEDESKRQSRYRGRGTPRGHSLLTNCIYLQDAHFEAYGVKVYGSSWHPLHGYSFSRKRGAEILEKWLKIPPVDVLLTHTPPLGHSDLFRGERWGCAELLNCVERRVRPKFHVFGHVHEQNGWTTNDETFFINVSICNHALEPVNAPTIFDVPLPTGVSKN